jgi:hypothetical protein
LPIEEPEERDAAAEEARRVRKEGQERAQVAVRGRARRAVAAASASRESGWLPQSPETFSGPFQSRPPALKTPADHRKVPFTLRNRGFCSSRFTFGALVAEFHGAGGLRRRPPSQTAGRDCRSHL